MTGIKAAIDQKLRELRSAGIVPLWIETSRDARRTLTEELDQGDDEHFGSHLIAYDGLEVRTRDDLARPARIAFTHGTGEADGHADIAWSAEP